MGQSVVRPSSAGRGRGGATIDVLPVAVGRGRGRGSSIVYAEQPVVVCGPTKRIFFFLLNRKHVSYFKSRNTNPCPCHIRRKCIRQLLLNSSMRRSRRRPFGLPMSGPQNLTSQARRNRTNSTRISSNLRPSTRMRTCQPQLLCITRTCRMPQSRRHPLNWATSQGRFHSGCNRSGIEESGQ